MEKYIKAIDSAWHVMTAVAAQSKDESIEDVRCRWEKYFEGMKAIALEDPEIGPAQFDILRGQIMDLTFDEWRSGKWKKAED